MPIDKRQNRCPGEAEYGRGLSRTTVHGACCAGPAIRRENYHEPSIGDTKIVNGVEFIWDSGQWVESFALLDCGYDCHKDAIYGFVPEAGCPVHDVKGHGK